MADDPSLGSLGHTIDRLTREVIHHPEKAQTRLALFEYLSFAGDLDRAERHLLALDAVDATAALGISVYRNVLQAERHRRAFLTTGVRPSFLGDIPRHAELLIEANACLLEGNHDAARAVLEESEWHRPVLSGLHDGTRFHDLRDSNEPTASVLEAFLGETYVWIPLEHIRSLEITRPKNLRDLLWIPARVEGWDGSIGDVFLPVLYPNSQCHTDDRIKLGKMTVWDAHEAILRGIGQRVFFVGAEEVGLLEMSRIVIDEIHTLETEPIPSSAAPHIN